MCGRFSLSADSASIIEHFAIKNSVVLKPRYNIAPSQVIPIIRTPGILEFIIWGLRPHWLAQDLNGYVNARADTIIEKPSFRNAFKQRRCLIISDGYFEWKPMGSIKQPYYVTRSMHKVFAFGGIWEGDTCALITQSEGKPLIVAKQDYKIWLDEMTKLEDLKPLLNKQFADDFTRYPVSTKVNNVQHDFAECIISLQ